MKHDVRIKRAYEAADAGDGYRVLVDRLWPRGVPKSKLKADLWLKEVAPSTELRNWFKHDVEKWPDFRKKYIAELKQNSECVDILAGQLRKGRMTLVYGAKDQEHNQAVVLRDFLSGHKKQ
ncbi:MAG TPA: DUF488 family protein [Woeseiaceae bacterium]|nr:DUF488 family protein [Woeseiaceae bacterium]